MTDKPSQDQKPAKPEELQGEGNYDAARQFDADQSEFAQDADKVDKKAREAADAVDALLSNEYEPVKITSVDFNSSVKSAYDQYRITKLAVSVNGGKYKNVSAITVKPKAKLKVRVVEGRVVMMRLAGEIQPA